MIEKIEITTSASSWVLRVLERRFALLPKKVIGGFTTWLQFYYVVIEWYQPYPSILPEEWRFKSKLGEFLNLETAEMAFEDKHL